MNMNRLLRLAVFLCVLAVVFSDGRIAVASDVPGRITAGEVTDDESLMKNFVEYAAGRLQDSASFADALNLLYDFRKVGGDWNEDSTYLILLSRNGGVYLHGRNRELEDQDWSDLQDATGEDVGQKFLQGGSVEYYGEGDQSSRVSYAFPFSAPHIPFANPDEPEFVLVGGFDYEPEPEDFGGAEVSCGEFFASYGLQQGLCPTVDARDVSTLDDLKVFVDEARHFFTAALVAPQIDPVLLRRIFRLDGPWKHVSTYIYIMDDLGNVIFNGANRDIEQMDLWNNEDNNGDKFIQELIATAGTGETVEYNWENPAVEGDGEGAGPGGDSLKLGYTIKIPVPVKEEGETKRNSSRVYIFGSGIYFGEQDGQSSGEGCVIAGAEDTIQNGLLSLFLILSALLLAVSLKRRSV